MLECTGLLQAAALVVQPGQGRTANRPRQGREGSTRPHNKWMGLITSKPVQAAKSRWGGRLHRQGGQGHASQTGMRVMAQWAQAFSGARWEVGRWYACRSDAASMTFVGSPSVCVQGRPTQQGYTTGHRTYPACGAAYMNMSHHPTPRYPELWCFCTWHLSAACAPTMGSLCPHHHRLVPFRAWKPTGNTT